ncbi:MAG TPA: glycosyltransferase family 39 protein [Acetobacteraceae bacterium]|nr:glycosyltransferase family 39 protein [Acetobacteraceae bacterium]
MTASRRGAVLLALLAALTALRLVTAGMAPLASDEAYYWIFSRALAPGYLDHPPMVALWIRAGTAIAGQGALGVRLLGPLAGALGSLLLFDAAEQLWPPGSPRAGSGTEACRGHAGTAAAALLNATLLAGVGAVIMTPDTPLLFFWTGCLWALARLLRSGRPAWWLAIGLFAGLALASKYTALLLWIGIGLWLVWVPSQRRWWRSPMLWGGTVLGALAFLPVVLWNAAHGWASFLRQGGRVGAWQPARAAQFLGELVGGQIGLATPLAFLLFAAGAGWAARRAWRDRDPAWSLLAALTLPGAALFVQHALGDRVQGNWPAILYPAAAVAAAGLGGRRWLRLRWPAVALGLAITLLVYVQASSFGLTLPPRIDPIARQLAGWKGLAGSVDAVRRAQAAGFVAADDYGVAAELARALPADVTVLGVAQRWRLFRLRAQEVGDAAGILVRRAGSGVPVGWRDARPIGEARRASHGVAVQRFTLWRVAGPPAALPAVVLPRYAPAAR